MTLLTLNQFELNIMTVTMQAMEKIELKVP